ncbi:MAG: hypothetical protein IKN29_07915 [Bacteroidales bacterium]|nr:hypothetical protein [Bacteroidales bacterium]
MEQTKLFNQMTTDEQVKYLTDLSEFIDNKLPRLEHISDAWERSDRKDMETGLRLLCAFQFARDFVDKALRYGDYAARARRLRVYIDKVKVEISKGLSMKGSDGHQYAIVPATVPQRRRGRPAAVPAASVSGIPAGTKMDAEMERQVKIARLLGIEVIIDQSTAPREKNNTELAEERQRRAEEEAKQAPSLFDNTDAAPAAAAAPVPSAAVVQQPTEQPAPVPAASPAGTPAITDAPDYRLHLDQKAPFLSTQELRADVSRIRALRTTAAAKAERAKTLADVGADAETIAPYAREAQEALEAYEAIYAAIDQDLATTYYRLLNDDSFRQRFLDRYKFKTMENVSKDLLYDLKKHYQKVQSPEFDLRCKTIIEQESPGYMERVKAEADRKKEVQDILRYLKRKDKDASDTRLATARTKFARLEELLGKKEARDYRPLLTYIEDENKRLNAEHEAEQK